MEIIKIVFVSGCVLAVCVIVLDILMRPSEAEAMAMAIKSMRELDKQFKGKPGYIK